MPLATSELVIRAELPQPIERAAVDTNFQGGASAFVELVTRAFRVGVHRAGPDRAAACVRESSAASAPFTPARTLIS